MTALDRLKGDITFLRGVVRTLRQTTPLTRHPTRILPKVIQEMAERCASSPALLSDRESFTYGQLAGRANQWTRWALANGVSKGDVVCLMMPNRPEYMAVWLGITRVGGVVALLNTNLRGHPLAHCIDVVAPKHVVLTAELSGAFASAEPHVGSDPQVWVHGGEARGDPRRVDEAVDALSAAAIPASELPPVTIEDRALYIYTSGTTGLPKAANVNHFRLMLASYAFAGAIGVRPDDRMYDCLPMYHTIGGVVATGALLVSGGATVIREKFSASEFWDDVVRWDCTLFQYIGELCRYLVNTPPSPSETRHRIRLACGNGLRPDVWSRFKTRFHLPRILEFYAATEGNCTLFNFEEREGAVGRLPWFTAHRFPIKIVRSDPAREMPVRDRKGRCIVCPPGEAGEVIGRIVNAPSKPGSRFDGYAERADNEKKILRDVFVPGDRWFRTGDLMRRDADGHFFFVDRIGDTFRWKGENVATSEVEEILTAFDGVCAASVYGVMVPGHEGRAGMAALMADRDLDLGKLRAHLAKELPPYARPLFLRLTPDLALTGTFKLKKLDLKHEGFDPGRTGDPIFMDDPGAGAYVRLDVAVHSRIMGKELAL